MHSSILNTTCRGRFPAFNGRRRMAGRTILARYDSIIKIRESPAAICQRCKRCEPIRMLASERATHARDRGCTCTLWQRRSGAIAKEAASRAARSERIIRISYRSAAGWHSLCCGNLFQSAQHCIVCSRGPTCGPRPRAIDMLRSSEVVVCPSSDRPVQESCVDECGFGFAK